MLQLLTKEDFLKGSYERLGETLIGESYLSLPFEKGEEWLQKVLLEEAPKGTDSYRIGEFESYLGSPIEWAEVTFYRKITP